MLTWIFLAGSAICMLYFLVIIFYAGITTTSAVIWLLAALFLFATAFVLRTFLNDPEKVPLRLPVTMITLCGAGVVILLVLEILIFYRIPATAEPGLDYVIVLGSSVKEDGPGKVLKKRLDKALEYYEANPGTVLILSGGKDGFDPVTEASVMRDYLLERGVDENSIMTEDESGNTMENILYSREKIAEVRGPGFEAPPAIGIITSNFHLYRATKIADKQKIGRVYGIASGCDPVLLPHLAVRDALAILKDRMVGNL